MSSAAPSAPVVRHEDLIRIARQAGDAIMAVYKTAVDIKTKSDNSPVTEADLKSHQIIRQELEKLTPDIPQLSEEADNIRWEERQGWDCYWLIDPLDGTREFIKMNDEFSVNIALVVNHESVQSVIYMPATGETFWARKGEGAWLSSPESEQQPLQVAKVESAGTWRLACSRSHNKNPERLVRLLGDMSYDFVPVGASLKYCRIAAGQIDCHVRLGSISEWDTAAAQCILEQAGGHMTCLSGQPLRYNTKASLLNPEFVAWGGTRPEFMDNSGL
ncbi:3'(2'),5'-bisphosphate nucleotidase CysQ [Endozoicomonadaceae bacterium StTr2]